MVCSHKNICYTFSEKQKYCKKLQKKDIFVVVNLVNFKKFITKKKMKMLAINESLYTITFYLIHNAFSNKIAWCPESQFMQIIK